MAARRLLPHALLGAVVCAALAWGPPTATRAPATPIAARLASIVQAAYPLAHAQGAAAPSPWDAVQGGARWRVDDLAIKAPSGTPAPWRKRRAALGLSTQTLAFAGRSMPDAHAAIEQLFGEELIDWERALIAANANAQQIPTAIAADWLRFLDEWPTLSDADRVRAHTSLRLRAMGTGMASTPTDCFASDLQTGALLLDLAAQEDATPGRRLRSRIEPPPVLDTARIQQALQHEDATALRAALLLLATVAPSTPIATTFELNRALDERHCAMDLPRAIIEAMLVAPSAWPRVAAVLQTARPDAPISDRWLWRIAVHRYLMGDADAVRATADMFTQWYPRDTEGSRYITLLGAIASGAVTEHTQGLPSTRSGSNPTYRWVAAEAARVRGDTEAAEEALAHITDMDPHFAAAWLSLAAARSKLGRGRGVSLAVDALQDIAPPLPIYRYWLDQLAQRRRATSGP